MNKIIIKLYLFNLVLLITHEIDSAFWHEWELFYLPGGIQFFLIINFAFILFFLFGVEKVIKREKHAYLYSYLLSACGIFAFVIHSIFILLGNKEFLLPVSIIVLILIFIISLIQLIVQLKIKQVGTGNNY